MKNSENNSSEKDGLKILKNGLDQTLEPTIEKTKFEKNSELVYNEIGHLDLKILGELIYELDKDQYQYIPVDIETFIKDDYYLGSVIGKEVYPIWVDTLKKIYPTPFFSPYSEVIVSTGIGCGKALSLDSDILTPNGFIKMKDVVLGQDIIGSDGETYQITGVFPQGKLQVVKVTFEEQDGNSTVIKCCLDHLWEVYHCKGKIIFPENKVVNTKYLLDNFKNEYTFKVDHPEFLDTERRYKNIINIELTNDYEEMQCISVNSPNNLYITNNYTLTHNSTMSTIGLVYDIYKTLCLKNPQKYYGLMLDTKIVFMMFSATKALAQGVNYEYLEKFFANSPFFQENVQLPRGKSQIFDKGIELSKNIYVEIGSQIRHALGKAVFGAVLDEANFQNENSKQAETTYTGILRRMQSRFQSGGGIIPGTLYVMSSPKNANSFLEERISKAKGIPTSFVLEGVPIWEVKKHILNMYSGKNFQVFMGSDTLDPCVIDESMTLTEEMKNNIMEVPIEYHDSFQKDLITSINDIAGRKTGNILNLIKQKKLITDMMVIPYNKRFTKPVIQLSFTDVNDTLMDYMNMDYFKNPYKKHCYRFVHIDLAKNRDRTGIGCCFAEQMEIITHQETLLDENFNFDDGTEISKLYKDTNLKSKVLERMYYLDWVVCLENKKGEDIPFDKIVDFLKFLKDIGYPIKVVTTDGYQGDYLRQRLTLKGLKAEYLSVSTKRNKQGRSYFINFVDLLKKQKIISVNHPVLYKELSELIDDGESVSHPLISPTGGVGHDDVAHGAVGAFTRCFMSKEVQSNTEFLRQMFQNNSSGSLVDMVKNNQKEKKIQEISKKFYIKKYF